MAERFVKVALKNALSSFDVLYTYLVPEYLHDVVTIGSRVLIPFGKKNNFQEAFVIDEQVEADSGFKIKSIGRLLNMDPVFNLEQLQLVKQMVRRYSCTYGAAISLLLPPLMDIKVHNMVDLIESHETPVLSQKQQLEYDRLVNLFLEKNKKTQHLDMLLDEHKFRYAFMKRMEEAGVVCIYEKIQEGIKQKTQKTVYITNPDEVIFALEAQLFKSAKQSQVIEFLLEYGETPITDCMQSCSVSRGVIKTLVDKGYLSYGYIDIESAPVEPEMELIYDEDFTLTEGQAKAYSTIKDSLEKMDRSTSNEFLLHGITGSGKTEIYLRLTKAAIEQGRGVILLVPEIALTAQVSRRFYARFQDEVAILHSRLTPRQRFDQWKRILNGQARVVVGARSAVFAPVKNLNLIFIDEEQDSSYLSEVGIRYDARTIARLRMLNQKGVLVLGSATPAIDTYQRALVGKSYLLELDQRTGSAVLPQVDIVDMRNEIKAGHFDILSRHLIIQMEQAFEKKHQVILLINRRGYYGGFLCKSCGVGVSCPNCSVSLTYHKTEEILLCHYCGFKQKIPYACSSCHSNKIMGIGLGSEQLEEYLLKRFPTQRVLRMDQDTTAVKFGHERILSRFEKQEADILVGTQMVAKGHDFHNVTLVGVLSTDQVLQVNNYKASEKGYQLFSQVSGRAGRGSEKGLVVLQSYNPEHYVMHYVKTHDYKKFFMEEREYRKALFFPPFSYILTIQISANKEDLVASYTQAIHKVLGELKEERNYTGVIIHKPVPAPIWRLKNQYKWQIVLKGVQDKQLVDFSYYLSHMKHPEQIRVTWVLDPA